MLDTRSIFIRVFLAGCLAICFQFGLGVLIAALTENPVWIAGGFLFGAALGVVVTRRALGLAFPAMGLLALTAVGPSFFVNAPLWGRVVNLRSVDDIPSDSSVAGYRAPGWRIDEERSLKERLTAGRGNRGYGYRVVAPLVGDGWTPAHPVEVWVAGEIRDFGRVLRSHPKFWSAPNGEFIRFVGVGVSGAQLQALRAARRYDLRTAEAPLIVTRTDSVAQSIRDQYLAAARALRWPFGAWILIVGTAAAMEWARAQPPFFRRRR